MPSYMSVEREKIQKAFALCHRCADNPDIESSRDRAYFRAIAHLIWQACGEHKEMPKTKDLGPFLEKFSTGAEAEAAGRQAYEHVAAEPSK